MRLSQPLFPINIQNYGSLINNKGKDNSKEKNIPILINKTVKINTPDKFYRDRRKLKAFFV